VTYQKINDILSAALATLAIMLVMVGCAPMGDDQPDSATTAAPAQNISPTFDHVGCLPDEPIEQGGQTPLVCQYTDAWQLCTWGGSKWDQPDTLTWHESDGSCGWVLMDRLEQGEFDPWDSSTYPQAYQDLTPQQRGEAQVWERPTD